MVNYPAAFPQVMAVAATGTDAKLTDFSNTGDELEIAAPGEKIKVLEFFGGQVVTSGTSIATPHITAAASLLWQKDPSKSNEFIRQLLSHSTKNIENTNECGMLDVTYALEMYDEFSENWNEEMVALPENTAEPETFEEIDDDTNYVEGLWYCYDKNSPDGRGHETLSNKANAVSNTTLRAIMKRGAIYPDFSKGMPGIDDNLEFHGYVGKGENVDYVASYIAITQIANGSSTTNYRNVRARINALDWNEAFNKTDGNPSNASHKRAFLWGVAMHTATDVFAHSTYYPIGTAFTSWLRIDHTTSGPGHCDNPNVIPSRFTAAAKTAELVVARYNSGTNYDGNAGQFNSFSAQNLYRIKNFVLYTKNSSWSGISC